MNPRPLSSTITQSSNFKSKGSISSASQFFWLTRRYLAIKTGDKINSLIMLIQAPIIALLICAIFNQISGAVLFMVSISSIWLGTQNAAREIVSEQAIYKRERMFNLKILPYLFSKITVLSIFAIIQCIIFVFILHLKYHDSLLELNQPIYFFAWMTFISICSSFLGLLLSSMVSTTEKAMTILPIILIPQIMLAGLIAKVSSSFVEILSYLTISRWAVEGFNNIQEKIIESIKVSNIPEEYEFRSFPAIDSLMKQFHDSYKDNFVHAGEIQLDIYIILIMTVIMIFGIFNILKKKDSVTI